MKSNFWLSLMMQHTLLAISIQLRNCPNYLTNLKIFPLKINYEKIEIFSIGAKKGVIRALSGFKTVDLSQDSVKILGVITAMIRIWQ